MNKRPLKAQGSCEKDIGWMWICLSSVLEVKGEVLAGSGGGIL